MFFKDFYCIADRPMMVSLDSLTQPNGKHAMQRLSSYLTTKEVAAMLRIAPQTLEKARSTGLGPQIPFVKVGRAVRYASDDVAAWIESKKDV
ncbi:helix-turn-helix domain-containing protein [Massilia sp. CFBP 13647]|uniref:helix-turn-helix domain-containing protein n=1 Tax=unclassified Massilia TaxID=2609279 RepID=UPI0035A5738C